MSKAGRSAISPATPGGAGLRDGFPVPPGRSRHYVIPGEPVAQARARIARNGHAYYPAKSAAYREKAALMLRAQHSGAVKFTGPLGAYITIWRTRPKGDKSVWPVKRPDSDNYLKMILDALKDAGVLKDDSQVCVLNCVKTWAVGKPEVNVTLAEL